MEADVVARRNEMIEAGMELVQAEGQEKLREQPGFLSGSRGDNLFGSFPVGTGHESVG